jgi:hypothetical protein
MGGFADFINELCQCYWSVVEIEIHSVPPSTLRRQDNAITFLRRCTFTQKRRDRA